MEFSILDFYVQCTNFFEDILETGKSVWNLFTSKFSSLVAPMEDGWIKDLLLSAIENLGDFSILEIGLGGGLTLFIFVSLLKYFNLLS